MSKVKVLQATNIEGVDRAVDEVVEVADEGLAEVLIRDAVVVAHTEEPAKTEKGTGTGETPAGEGEAASA